MMSIRPDIQDLINHRYVSYAMANNTSDAAFYRPNADDIGTIVRVSENRGTIGFNKVEPVIVYNSEYLKDEFKKLAKKYKLPVRQGYVGDERYVDFIPTHFPEVNFYVLNEEFKELIRAAVRKEVTVTVKPIDLWKADVSHEGYNYYFSTSPEVFYVKLQDNWLNTVKKHVFGSGIPALTIDKYDIVRYGFDMDLINSLLLDMEKGMDSVLITTVQRYDERYICRCGSDELIFTKEGCISLDGTYGKKEGETKEEKRGKSLKSTEKSKFKTKFVNGDRYVLKGAAINRKTAWKSVFELKKFAYKINDLPVDILIMKQLSGEKLKMHTLSKQDCKLLHLKYEDGLQVFPMKLRWVRCKK